jgi:hypothetical protein
MMKLIWLGLLATCCFVAVHGEAPAAGGELGCALARAAYSDCIVSCSEEYGRYVWTGSQLIIVYDDAQGWFACNRGCGSGLC